MRYLVFFVLAGLLSACGGGRASSSLPQTQPLGLDRSRGPLGVSSVPGLLAPGSATEDVWLYVSGLENNVVTIYDLSELGTPEVGKITTGVSAPIGLAVDSQGNLYVANTTGSVSIYPPGAAAPSLTLTQGLTEPISVAVDNGGNVYVANRGGSSPDIVVFPPGSTTPSNTITSPLIEVPNQVQFDASQDLYYSDNSTGVSEMAYGSSVLVSLGLQGLTRTNGVAIDPDNGNLFVGNFGNGQDDVLVFKPGAVQASSALRGSKGADMLAMAAVDGLEYVLVPDAYTNVVHVFLDESKTSIVTLHPRPAHFPEGVAVKPAGVP
jgi:DNA-binding beta-propeller fold protein YncE